MNDALGMGMTDGFAHLRKQIDHRAPSERPPSSISHFSPISGVHMASDHALLLDVARFKYPPHWVPVATLYAAMQAEDPATGRARGWVTLRRSSRPASVLFTARCDSEGGLAAFSAALQRLRTTIVEMASTDMRAVLEAMFAPASHLPRVIEPRALALSEQAPAAKQLLAALRATPVFAVIADVVGDVDRRSWSPEAATLLVLALPAEVWSTLPEATLEGWLATLERARLPAAVRLESEHIHRQLADLGTLGPGGACARCK